LPCGHESARGVAKPTRVLSAKAAPYLRAE